MLHAFLDTAHGDRRTLTASLVYQEQALNPRSGSELQVIDQRPLGVRAQVHHSALDALALVNEPRLGRDAAGARVEKTFERVDFSCLSLIFFPFADSSRIPQVF